MPASNRQIHSSETMRETVLEALNRYGYLDAADIRLLFEREIGDATSKLLVPPEDLDTDDALSAKRLRHATLMRAERALAPLIAAKLIRRVAAFGGRSAYILTHAGAQYCRNISLDDARTGRHISSLDGATYHHRRMANIYSISIARGDDEGYNEWSLENDKLPGVTTPLLEAHFSKVPDGLVVCPPDRHSGSAHPVNWIEAENRSNSSTTFDRLAEHLSHRIDKPIQFGPTTICVRNIVILTVYKSKEERRYFQYCHRAFELLKLQHRVDYTTRVYFVRQHFHNGHFRGISELDYAQLIPGDHFKSYTL